ncbi:MAG: Protein of unknown function rane [Chitinophagaceae bacterium]|nr:Protein of unknown function rane [Chitinophagaceae bacterium]
MIFFTKFLTTLQPHKFFAVCATVFGLIFLVMTPPFQTPDEINHFYRAYEISDGDFLAQKQDNRVGAELPKSLVDFAAGFRSLTWTKTARVKPSTILDKFDQPLNPQDRQFVDFVNTAMYSPVSYAPQAAILFYLKPFELSPIALFYWARLITLLFWIAAIYYAIRMMPFHKWLFTLVALLPMSLLINMSINADVVTNALAFFSIAYGCKLAYKESSVSPEHFLVLCLLIILLASAKIVYTPVLLIVVLLIPKAKFGTDKIYFNRLMTLAAFSLVTALFWARIMKKLYLPYSQYNPAYRNDASLIDCTNMYEQLRYILSHGFYLIKVFIHSMIESADMYYQGFIGTFGWLDTPLPSWFIVLAYVIILLVLLIDGNKEVKVSLYQKGILLTGFSTIVFLVLLTQHLTRDCVGGDVIVNIQGRYFIPAAPLLFFSFYTTRFRSKWIALVVLVFSLFALAVSMKVLYDRYYKQQILRNSKIITCGAEKTVEGNLFASNLPNKFFENANTQSKDQARSGSYSAKVNAKDMFTYTYRLHDCESGDQLVVEVWRLGKAGRIALVNDANHFYVETLESVQKDSTGWERLELTYTIPKDLTGDVVTVYLFNSEEEATYFDDMQITHLKFE